MTSILGTTRRHDIVFHANGRIDIGSRVAAALELRDGDSIDIMTSESEFFLFVASRGAETDGKFEATCRPSKSGSRHFRAWSRHLSMAVLKECRKSGRAYIPAGETVTMEDRKAMALITRLAR